MKKHIIILCSVILTLMLTGCAKIADEEKIKTDLETSTQFNFLDEGEQIDELVIDKRQTNKDERVDTVWCTVTTSDSEVSYQKKAELTYGLYDKDGWLLDDVSVNDSYEWIKTPLKGVNEENVMASLYGQFIMAEGEMWEITSNNIVDFTIDSHDTKLEEKKDTIVATVTLDADVEEAKGQLTINYLFFDKWELNSISEKEKFLTTVKPEVALNITTEDLIAELAKQTFEYYEKPEGISIYSVSDIQTISLAESEISDFTITKQETSLKGTRQVYTCNCILTKPNAVFSIETDIQYYYEVTNGWNVQINAITAKLDSLNIEGEWGGTYIAAGEDGEAFLSITEVTEDGVINAVYSWSPYVPGPYEQPGSYSLSGTFDKATLSLKLTAGDWIDKPSSFFMGSTKRDIYASLYVESSEIIGVGHNSCTFWMKQ